MGVYWLPEEEPPTLKSKYIYIWCIVHYKEEEGSSKHKKKNWLLLFFSNVWRSNAQFPIFFFGLNSPSHNVDLKCYLIKCIHIQDSFIHLATIKFNLKQHSHIPINGIPL